MDRKNKFMIGLLMSVLFLMPVLFAASSQPALMERNSIEPIRNFGLSADCVVDTTSTKVTNPDDTDNLYGGGYKTYIAVVNTSYAGTGASIDNITTTFYKAATDYFSILFIQSTGVFSESAGATKVRLDTSTNATSGNYCNLTINFKVEWAMDDVDDVDMNITVWNDTNSTSSQKTDADYDFDTDLTLTSDVFFTYAQAQQGDLMTVNTLTYSYEDSAATVFPLASETDFYVSRAQRAGWPIAYYEAASYSDITGVATWTPMAASGNEHTDTFTLYAVNQAGGGSDTSLMDSEHTDTINIIEGSPGDQTTRRVVDVTTDFLATPEGMGILVVAIVVLGFGGYYYFGKNTIASRRKTKRRKRR